MTTWQVESRGVYADGRSFDDFGVFEILEGRIRYAVDPTDPRNVGIVDLGYAPRDEDGYVRFSGDYTIVAPRDRPARKLLVDVPNRGRRLAFSALNRASPADLLENPCASGDGFLFRRGFALASIGWQWDVPVGLRLDAPEVLENGEPVEGDVVCRVQPGSDRPFVSFGQLGEVTYPPADLDDPMARLFVRDDDNAPLVEIDRRRWRFARDTEGVVEPSNRFIRLEAGFEKGRIYTLVYRARGARVTGCGLLALRDAAESLRSGEGPCPTASPMVLAFGASQTGRVLRHLLHLGLNTGSTGSQVFDGVHVHIAGGQRGDFNHRFAQPSSAGVAAAGQRFPFSGTVGRDPASGVSGGLYENLAHMPKVVITNTSFEYWRGDAALTHVSPDGTADLDPHPLERNYLFAGTHHVNGILPPTSTFAVTGEKARYTFNVVDHSSLVRAAFANLDAWVAQGRAPPDSRVPTLGEATLVERRVVLGKFAAVEGFEGLDPDRLGGLAALDLGDRADDGVCAFPAVEGFRYARLVSDVDDTLNELAGVRLPEVVLPIGCHTGWNPRHPDHGASELPAMFVGFSLFGGELAAREEVERRARKCVRGLVGARFILAEDAERVVARSLRVFDTARELGVTDSDS
ncbi:MAG: alpha/beta hydrolase domain-containing protein [Gammaproteobacteria bacterium]|nr:alpha/beta hydrolase domain-containing protein [Gammaproteobacteria bacterium]